MKNKCTPDIRFSRFSEDWEERMLGDLVIDVSRPLKMVDDDIYQLVTVKRRNGGIVSRGTFKGSEVLVKSQFIIKSGDYLISKRQVVHGANGIVPDYLDGSIVSNEYLILHGTKDLNIDFFSLISELPSMYKNFFLSSYGIDVEKLVFNVLDWKKRKISIPSISEQHKITSFFEVINRAIILHQQELTILKQTNQGFLQKMFPKEGESVPEVRFPGFTGNWENRKLDSIVDRLRSYSLSRDVETSEYTGYKYIHYGDIHTKVADIIDESSNLPNIKAGNYELLKKRDLVLADASEDYQGIATPAVITIDIPFKLVSGLHTIALRPKHKQVDSLFLYYLIKSPVFREYGYKAGTGMKVFGISVTNLLKFESMFPLLEEQVQIGKFLKYLDDTITLHQRELEALKETKKAFLQKMFV